VRPTSEIPYAPPVPRLTLELPSWPRVFLDNLRDLLFPKRLPPLELRSAPAHFWDDVFVNRPLPWNRFFQSAVYHILGIAALIGLTQFFAMRPRVVAAPAFDHSQVVYYRPSEYLPPLDSRSPSDPPPRKADSELSRQEIISVPREAENRSQTIVAAPQIKLKRDVAMPNIVAWSEDVKRPQLAVQPAPLSPAAQIDRLPPTLQTQVAAPPQDPTRSAQPRNLPTLQVAVAAPPSDVRSASPAMVPGLQPALIAPPTDIASSPATKVGTVNIGPSPVIAPAPQLAVVPQRAVPGGGTPLPGPQVAPPPPSLSGSADSGGSGRVIALNLHPALSAPADPPTGNRRGAFSSTPEGHAGTTGAPGSVSGNTESGSISGAGHGNGGGGASTAKESSGAPAGLYVSSAPKPSPVAGDPASKTPATMVNPNLIASVRPPHVTAARPMQPDNTAKLSEPERAVFGNRRFYSLALNMPNLNSAGGSWIIRFAELKHDLGSRDPNEPAQDLSQPMATRKVDPAYPIQLMRENVHGTVILYAVIHADGTVGNVRILRGVDERLDRFASEAVAKWKFDPATKNGTPVDVEATFQIPFRPTNVGSNF